MATIRERGPERGPYQWQAQVLRKGQSPQYKTFNNRADAEKWARQIEANGQGRVRFAEGSREYNPLRGPGQV